MPRYLESIIREYTEDLEEVVIAPHPGEDLQKTVRQRFEMFGPVAFMKYGLYFSIGKILSAFPYELQRLLTNRYYSVHSICNAHDIPLCVERDVNRENFVNHVRSLDPDLVLSISCGQKLESELLSIPPEGAINLHGSLLPKYRGRATAFWVLYHDEEYSGVTAHYMNQELDGGNIICQRRFPISDDDTMHDVYNKVVNTGTDLALDVIEQVRTGDVDSTPNSSTDGEYYSIPDAADRSEFLRRGNKFR